MYRKLIEDQDCCLHFGLYFVYLRVFRLKGLYDLFPIFLLLSALKLSVIRIVLSLYEGTDVVAHTWTTSACRIARTFPQISDGGSGVFYHHLPSSPTPTLACLAHHLKLPLLSQKGCFFFTSFLTTVRLAFEKHHNPGNKKW